MPSIGSNITEPIPAVGTAGTTYATQLVAFLTEVKNRLEAKVPLSSILIGALDMANNAFQNVQYLGLYEQASQPTTPVGSVQRFNNDLWYVSDGGAFQMTDGASLNASSLGGITGDYGSPNPAELRFVDADLTYYFYDNFATTTWAHIRARDVEIAAGATSALRVRLDWGGAGSYTLTLPPAPPAAGQKRLLSLDENGDILQDGVSTTSVTATQFYHTADTTQVIDLRYTGTAGAGLVGGQQLTASGTYQLSIVLPVGSVMTSWDFHGNKTTSGANSISAQMYKRTYSGAAAAQGSAQSNNANAPTDFTVGETGTTYTLGANETFIFQVTASAWSGGGIEEALELKYTYTRPS